MGSSARSPALIQKWCDKWRGGNAKLWDYTVSHKSLTIRVEIPGEKGNLHIGCSDVTYICGPTKWENSSFEFEQAGEDMILRDVTAGLEIKCGVIEVFENCKPVF